MSTKLQRNIMQRWDGNPVLTPEDLPFQASDIHNAGAVRFDGECLLLLTVESLQGDCAIYKATSRDGRSFTVDPEPFIAAPLHHGNDIYATEGVRDPRITPFDGTYYVTYLSESEYGTRLSLVQTDDFEKMELLGHISEPDTKNGMLFPARFGGRYARLERPREGGNIWISYSTDLKYWGDWDCVMTPRHGYWDYNRVGASAPPIRTDCGWLLVYYGVRNTPSGPLFRLGVAFLDLEDPSKVIGRSNIPVLAPYERYERIGDVNNLVFSCGAVISHSAAELEIYYGAAQSCVCVGTVPFESLQGICMGGQKQED